MEIDMSVQTTFTEDQIKFLLERLFDVMAADFDYKLKTSKRKAILAKVMGARNYDALLQRSTAEAGAVMPAKPLPLIMSNGDITFISQEKADWFYQRRKKNPFYAGGLEYLAFGPPTEPVRHPEPPFTKR
jgi:hypothetical protein